MSHAITVYRRTLNQLLTVPAIRARLYSAAAKPSRAILKTAINYIIKAFDYKICITFRSIDFIIVKYFLICHTLGDQQH